jgi:catalase
MRTVVLLLVLVFYVVVLVFADPKDDQLEQYTVTVDGTYLTTNQGVKIADDQNSLKGGSRGPTLLEDFLFREKMQHFDHERIPERIVHARGAAAHGYFQVYSSQAEYTRAKFLQDPTKKTPVFVRFSTVAGFRGSADSARFGLLHDLTLAKRCKRIRYQVLYRRWCI